MLSHVNLQYLILSKGINLIFCKCSSTSWYIDTWPSCVSAKAKHPTVRPRENPREPVTLVSSLGSQPPLVCLDQRLLDRHWLDVAAREQCIKIVDNILQEKDRLRILDSVYFSFILFYLPGCSDQGTTQIWSHQGLRLPRPMENCPSRWSQMVYMNWLFGSMRQGWRSLDSFWAL